VDKQLEDSVQAAQPLLVIVGRLELLIGGVGIVKTDAGPSRAPARRRSRMLKPTGYAP